MRQLVFVIALAALTATCFAQAPAGQPYGSVGGFGSVLHPGTGHPPGAFVPLPPPLFAGRLARDVAGRQVNPASVRDGHRNGHNQGVIVPYPVYMGNYGYDPSMYANPPQSEAPAYANQSPSVVINQNFIPDRAAPVVREYGDSQSQSGMRMYEYNSHPYDNMDPRPARRPAPPDDQPTLYLIAFTDHTIVSALGYWMEGGTLHYVSAEHSLNQASLDLIDRKLSQRLNDERGVEFKLPQLQ
jgi:hypothetical protein